MSAADINETVGVYEIVEDTCSTENKLFESLSESIAELPVGVEDPKDLPINNNRNNYGYNEDYEEYTGSSAQSFEKVSTIVDDKISPDTIASISAAKLSSVAGNSMGNQLAIGQSDYFNIANSVRQSNSNSLSFSTADVAKVKRETLKQASSNRIPLKQQNLVPLRTSVKASSANSIAIAKDKSPETKLVNRSLQVLVSRTDPRSGKSLQSPAKVKTVAGTSSTSTVTALSTARSLSSAFQAKSKGQLRLSTVEVKAAKLGRASSVTNRSNKSSTAAGLETAESANVSLDKSERQSRIALDLSIANISLPMKDKVASEVMLSDFGQLAAEIDTQSLSAMSVRERSQNSSSAAIMEHIDFPASVRQTREEINISLCDVSDHQQAQVAQISNSTKRLNETVPSATKSVQFLDDYESKFDNGPLAISAAEALHLSTANVFHASIKELPPLPEATAAANPLSLEHSSQSAVYAQEKSRVSTADIEEQEITVPKSANESRDASHILKLSTADVAPQTVSPLVYFVNPARSQPSERENTTHLVSYTNDSLDSKDSKSLIDLSAVHDDQNQADLSATEVISAADAVKFTENSCNSAATIENDGDFQTALQNEQGNQAVREIIFFGAEKSFTVDEKTLTPHPPPYPPGKHARPPTVDSTNSLQFIRRNRARVDSISSNLNVSQQLSASTANITQKSPIMQEMADNIANTSTLTEYPPEAEFPLTEGAELRPAPSATSVKSSAQSSISPERLEETTIPLNQADKGRVKVFVRIRPLFDGAGTVDNSESSARNMALSVEPELNQVTIVDNGKHRQQRFQFDGVFSPLSANNEIFDVIAKPLIHSALNGFNGTLMAYGQTGTGKTFTLTSPDGLMPKMINHLFNRIARKSLQNHNYKVTCSYVQIYNERIYDLLAPEKPTSQQQRRQSLLSSSVEDDLLLRENPDSGIYVEGLSEYTVRSPKEVFELVKLGRSKLVFAETKMNRASSRSHAICFLTVERTVKTSENSGEVESNAQFSPVAISSELSPIFTSAGEDGFENYSPDDAELSDENEAEIKEEELSSLLERSGNDLLLRGRLSICDLAGSERVKKTQATGDRFIEAQQINLSLLELGNVIQALTDPSRHHVPFRNSTLTRLLQESLGGNCKTSLIVCVSPSKQDLSETKGSLAFGFRAMRVLNKARVNVEIDYKTLSDALTSQLTAREEECRRKDAEMREIVTENNRLKLEMQALRGQAENSTAAATFQMTLASVTKTTTLDYAAILQLAASGNLLRLSEQKSTNLQLLRSITSSINADHAAGKSATLNQPIQACARALNTVISALEEKLCPIPQVELLEAIKSVQFSLSKELNKTIVAIENISYSSELCDSLKSLSRSLDTQSQPDHNFGESDLEIPYQAFESLAKFVKIDSILLGQSVWPLLILYQVLGSLAVITDLNTSQSRIRQLEKDLNETKINLEHQINENQELMARMQYQQPQKQFSANINAAKLLDTHEMGAADCLPLTQIEAVKAAESTASLLKAPPKSAGTQTIPVLVREFSDVDDEADRKADKSAEKFCVVAGKECTIM